MLFKNEKSFMKKRKIKKDKSIMIKLISETDGPIKIESGIKEKRVKK